MPFREKSAWLHLTALLLAYIPYFSISLFQGLPTTMPGLDQLWKFGAAATSHALIVIVGSIVLAMRTPSEAKAPADERDRGIELNGLKWAYYALMTGMIIVGVAGPFQLGGWQLVQRAAFVIVIAEVIHYACVLIAYRRQAA